jgi:hypothetical protein
MSIFHLTVRSVSRASGRSAVAAAAYRAGERLLNARDGRVHDYTRKPVLEAFIMVPDHAPKWMRNRSTLWNGVEAAERRKDAKVAREYELALPADLNPAQRRSLTIAFAGLLIDRYDVVVDIALHPPNAEGDQRNYHAHLLTTTRTATPDGFGAKTRQLDVSSTASVEVEVLRAAWADLINASLAKAKVVDTVDHRSFARQGRAVAPTRKMGPAVTAIERRALRNTRSNAPPSPVTPRGKANALIQEARALAAYIERGLAFIQAEQRRIGLAAHKLANISKPLRVAALQVAAAQLARKYNPPQLANPTRTRNSERQR